MLANVFFPTSSQNIQLGIETGWGFKPFEVGDWNPEYFHTSYFLLNILTGPVWSVHNSENYFFKYRFQTLAQGESPTWPNHIVLIIPFLCKSMNTDKKHTSMYACNVKCMYAEANTYKHMYRSWYICKQASIMMHGYLCKSVSKHKNYNAIKCTMHTHTWIYLSA